MTWGLELIKKAIQVANSSIGFGDRLQGILDLLIRLEGMDRVVLFTFSPDQETLEVNRISPRNTAGELQSLPLGKNSFKDLIQNRRPLIITPINRKEHKGLFKNPLFKGFNSLTALPVEDDNVLYGILGLLSQRSLTPEPRQLEQLTLVNWELAGIIRNSKIYTESKKRIAELSVLYQVGKFIGSTLELDDLIKRAVAIIAQVINATGSALMIVEKKTGEVVVEAEFGQVPSRAQETLRRDILDRKNNTIFPSDSPPSAGNTGLPSKGKRPPLTSPSSGPEEAPSTMGVALNFKGPYRGRLCVYGKISLGGQSDSRFYEDDLSILSTIGNIIASAMENALTFQKMGVLARRNEEMVKNLSILHQIDIALMTTASIKELPYVILEAITLKEGLGFNRAILLMADEGNKFLTPLAWSVQEQKINKPAGQEETLTSRTELSRLLVEQANQIKEPPGGMNSKFKNIKIPLTPESGILARTFLDGQSFIIENAPNDLRTNPSLIKLLKLESFAAIPMIGKDKVIGVIEVDNFIDKRPISQEDLRLLSMLAHQAGQALENARLYDFIEKTNQELKVTRERLIETEKMVAIGEMASGLAHEIRNPLVSIGGFVRRLNKRFQDDSQVQTYFQVIINEVERLEKVLNEVMDFYKDPRGKYKEWDLNRIVEQALILIQNEIEKNKIVIQKNWGKIPPIFGDDSQLRHVFYNLFQNSCQAMPQGGELSIRTFLDKGANRSWIVCEIKDTGGGIPLELLHNIFNPFFTTKATGSGLGLSIVHKIITRHQGEVDIDNHPGEGVSFSVKFPLGEESQHFKKIKINGEENHESDINRR